MADPLEIEERNFYNEYLDGAYTEFPEGFPPVLLVDPYLPYEDREALELEGLSYATCWGPRDGRMFCYKPVSLEEMDRARIKAYRRIVDTHKPEWVEQVRMATLMDNEVYTIIHLSGVPPYPAVAILENMRGRGELPE